MEDSSSGEEMADFAASTPRFSPLATPMPNVPVPAVQGVSAQQIGLGMVAITGVGLAAHAVGQVATGRMFKGGPVGTNSDQHVKAEKKDGDAK